MLTSALVRRPWFGPVTRMLLIALAIMGMAASRARAQDDNAWSDVQTLATGLHGGHALAASGSNIYLAYGTGPVYFRRSIDAGAVFSAPIRLSEHGIIHETDSIAAEAQHVFAITFALTANRRDWCCDRDLGDLMLHRSTDAGASWLPPVPLTTSGAAFRVSVAVSLPYVHVVWSDFRGGRWAIYYRRSSDGGATWEREQRLVAPGLEETNRPQIAVLGKSVDVVWEDNRDGNGPCYTMPHCTEVYAMRSPDAGASWSNPQRLTHNSPQPPLLAGRPDIAAFGDGALMVAYDQDLEFAQGGVEHGLRSPDGGETWEVPMQFGHTPGSHPAVAALGHNGVVAWFDRRFGGSNTEIYARLSEDSGRTWREEERVSFSPGVSSTPHVAFTPGFLHVIWLEGAPGGFDLLYRRRATGTAE